MKFSKSLSWPLFAVLLYLAALILCGTFYARGRFQPEYLQLTGASLVNRSEEEVVVTARGFGLEGRGLNAYLSLDLTNRRAVIAKLPISGMALDVKVIDDKLYVLQNNKGIKVYSLGLPAAPEQVRAFSTGTKVWSLDPDGGRLYMSSLSRGVSVYNLPGERHLFSVDTHGISHMTVHRDHYLFVAEGREGVSIHDVGDYRKSQQLAHLALKGQTVDLALYGSYLLAAAQNGGLSLIDIRKPHLPRIQQTLGQDRFYTKLQVVGDLVYAADKDRRIDVFELGSDNRLHAVTSLPLAGQVRDFLLDGNILYLAESSYGVSAIDVSDPRRPLRHGSVGTSGNPRALALYDNYLYVASSQQGVQVVDTRRFAPFHFPFELDTPGEAQQVVVDGRWLFVADGNSGLQVVDRSDPGEMKLIANLPTPGKVTRLVKQDNLLYLGVTGQGVWVIDVSLPAAPRHLGQIQTGGTVSDLLVRGTNLFVSETTRRKLLRLDISDPRQPWLAESIDMPGRAWRMAAFQEDILVACEKAGLQIVRFEPNQEARLVGSLSTPWPMSEFSTTIGLAVRDHYAYLVQGEQGVLVVDIADPENPKALQLLDIPQTLGIGLAENFAVILTRWQGYAFLDISAPGKPFLAANIYLPRIRSGFVVEGNMLYSPGHTRGVNVLPLPLKAKEVDTAGDLSLRFAKPGYAGWYDLSVASRQALTSLPGVFSAE